MMPSRAWNIESGTATRPAACRGAACHFLEDQPPGILAHPHNSIPASIVEDVAAREEP